MHFRQIFIGLIALLTLASAACTERTEARRNGCQIKVGIVFDIGGKNDRSFNAAAWDGVKRAERDMPICLYDVEPGNPTSIEPAPEMVGADVRRCLSGVSKQQGRLLLILDEARAMELVA